MCGWRQFIQASNAVCDLNRRSLVQNLCQIRNWFVLINLAFCLWAMLFTYLLTLIAGVEDMFAWLSSRLLDLRLENDKLLEQSRAAPSGSVSADERKSVKLNEDLTAPSAAGCSC
jgi:hypothetical protein